MPRPRAHTLCCCLSTKPLHTGVEDEEGWWESEREEVPPLEACIHHPQKKPQSLFLTPMKRF